MNQIRYPGKLKEVFKNTVPTQPIWSNDIGGVQAENLQASSLGALFTDASKNQPYNPETLQRFVLSNSVSKSFHEPTQSSRQLNVTKEYKDEIIN